MYLFPIGWLRDRMATRGAASRKVVEVAQASAEAAMPEIPHAPDRTLQNAVELVNAELESAAITCRRQSERGLAQLQFGATAAALIRGDSESAAQAALVTSANVAAMAVAGEQLSATSQEIASLAARSASTARQAVSSSEHAAKSTTALAVAAKDISEVVRAIAALAARTNLIALNAAIEAARAGPAGLGFAVVASEVKELSRQTAEATRQIDARIQSMQQATRVSVDAMQEIGVAITGIGETSAAVATAVEEQKSTIREVAKRLQDTANSTTLVAATMGEIATRSMRVSEATDAARSEAIATASTVEALRGDLSLQLLRASSALSSVPLALVAEVSSAKLAQPVNILELSETEALVRFAENCDLSPDATLHLKIAGIGVVSAKVAGASNNRAILALTPTIEAQGALVGLLTKLRNDGARFAACAQSNAAEIAVKLSSALRAGELTERALFDTSYQVIPDSDPVQFRNGLTDFADRRIRPVLDAALSFDPRIVGAFIVDHNGYAPTHNTKVSQEQRPGDPLWNARNCRNRWKFEDRAGIAAGRTTRETLLQCYERNMGGGERMTINEADAPIIVDSRHWGALRVMYKPATVT